jgi:hypothetical protein
MKNKKVLSLAALLLATGLLASCGNNSSSVPGTTSGATSGATSAATTSAGSVAPAKDVFANGKIYLNQGATDSISVKVEVKGNIQSIACGRIKAEAGQYSYADGVLTLGGGFLSQLAIGEKSISVVGDSTVKVSALVCTKVITTADEFQAINTDATSLQGTYILGNDIDLSSIANFEPLGWYITETSTKNAYFHGILEGNGHTIKNAKVYWSDTTASNYNVYSNTGTYKFTHEGHVNGDNVGLFQTIGSSGVVRNVNFSGIKVRGRTICGVIAGNCMGTVENCFIDSSCSVEMGTHFYDDDCNMGGAFGIVAGTGNVSNVICQCTSQILGATSGASFGGVTVEKAGIYLDWNDDYKGKTGNGWDHGTPATNDNPWWKQCGVDKVKSDGTTKTTDSNSSNSDGQYAFVGKCWGTVANCVAQKFQITPMDGTARDIYFGQTHLAVNKSTSGESDMGALTDDQILSASDMKVASKYSAFDQSIWSIEDGKVPSLISQYAYVA